MTRSSNSLNFDHANLSLQFLPLSVHIFFFKKRKVLHLYCTGTAVLKEQNSSQDNYQL